MLLREARERAGLSRETLAARSGISARCIYDIEHGRKVPRRSTRAVLAVSVGVPRDRIDWPTAVARAAA